MIEKQTVVDKIEIDRNGSVFVRYGLLLVENGKEISCNWHRTVFHPGDDVDMQASLVNQSLAEIGHGVNVPADDILKIKSHAAVSWKPDVISAFEKRKAEQKKTK